MLGVSCGEKPRQPQHGGSNRHHGLSVKDGKAAPDQADKPEPAHHPLANKSAVIGAGYMEFIGHARTLTRPSAPGNSQNVGAL